MALRWYRKVAKAFEYFGRHQKTVPPKLLSIEIMAKFVKWSSIALTGICSKADSLIGKLVMQFTH